MKIHVNQTCINWEKLYQLLHTAVDTTPASACRLQCGSLRFEPHSGPQDFQWWEATASPLIRGTRFGIGDGLSTLSYTCRSVLLVSEALSRRVLVDDHVLLAFVLCLMAAISRMVQWISRVDYHRQNVMRGTIVTEVGSASAEAILLGEILVRGQGSRYKKI